MIKEKESPEQKKARLRKEAAARAKERDNKKIFSPVAESPKDTN